MGFLNILGYIGVGLGVALILLLISYLWSRSIDTHIDEEGHVLYKERGDGNWARASVFSAFVMIVISALLLFNLAHFSILKSIGLGLLASIVIFLVVAIISFLIVKFKENYFPLALILCLLDGAGFAVLASVWGWF